MDQDDIPRIALVLNPLLRKHKLKAVYPLPVWDDTGALAGVQIHKELKKGGVDCIATASFVLTTSEIRNPKRLSAKAQIAVDAINNEIQMTIRKKVKPDAKKPANKSQPGTTEKVA